MGRRMEAHDFFKGGGDLGDIVVVDTAATSGVSASSGEVGVSVYSEEVSLDGPAGAETDIDVVLLAGEPGSVVLGVAVAVVEVSSEDATDAAGRSTTAGSGTLSVTPHSTSSRVCCDSISGKGVASVVGDAGGVLISSASLTI